MLGRPPVHACAAHVSWCIVFFAATLITLALPEWAVSQQLIAVLEDPEILTSSGFGRTVGAGDIDGDGFTDIVVAANKAVYDGVDRAGMVYVFFGGPDHAYDSVTSITPPVAQYGEFGRFLRVADINQDGHDDLLIPAFRAAVDTLRNVGKVYVYLGSDVLDADVDLTLTQPDPQETAQYGGAVAAGDVNGDGHLDILVGAHLADAEEVHDAGVLYVYLGGDSLDAEADRVMIEPQPTSYSEGIPGYYPPGYGAEFGRDVDVGDLNGDGIDDIVAGACIASVDGEVWAGRAHVFLGGASLDEEADFTLLPPETPRARMFARQIRVADVNGDGFDDAVVGAAGADLNDAWPYPDSAKTEGRIYIFLGGHQFDDIHDLVLEEPVPQVGAQLARDGLAIGNYDGDGYADIIAAAPYATAGVRENAGRVQVFFGSFDLDGRSDGTLAAPEEARVFGASAAIRERILAIAAADNVFVYDTTSPGTGIGSAPRSFDVKVLPGYPNPAGGEVHLEYTLGRSASVEIAIYNTLGQILDTPVRLQRKAPGRHNVRWNASAHPSGIYFWRLAADGQTITRKFVVTRQ